MGFYRGLTKQLILHAVKYFNLVIALVFFYKIINKNIITFNLSNSFMCFSNSKLATLIFYILNASVANLVHGK